MRERAVTDIRELEPALGVKRTDTQLPLSFDGLAAQRGNERIPAVIVTSWPGGQITHCQVQRCNLKFSGLILGKIPEQQPATINRHLFEINSGRAGAITFLRRLLTLCRRVV